MPHELASRPLLTSWTGTAKPRWSASGLSPTFPGGASSRLGRHGEWPSCRCRSISMWNTIY